MNSMSMNTTSELTIVIPAKNEAKLIPRLLTSLTNQDYSKMSSTKVLVLMPTRPMKQASTENVSDLFVRLPLTLIFGSRYGSHGCIELHPPVPYPGLFNQQNIEYAEGVSYHTS